jgi:TIGR03009 family protein
MVPRFGRRIAVGLLLATIPATGWSQNYQPSPPRSNYPTRQAPPRQPAYQPPPAGQRPVGQQQPMVPPVAHAPFVLAPQQQDAVDGVLREWERKSAEVKRFECGFARFEYDGTFGDPNKVAHLDVGQIKYEAPDKGMLRVDGEVVNGQLVKGQRAEQWISDGKSVFEYDFQRKILTEHKLPPELQGKEIANGPMPFLFGAKADQLKSRYWIRLVEPPPGTANQVWMEAWPRFREDAANFRTAEIILTTPEMLPFALRLNSPNGNDRTAFQFSEMMVNSNNLLEFFQGDPFKANKPRGWEQVVQEPRPAQFSGQPPAGARR